MARIISSKTVLLDLEKLTDFLLEINPQAAVETADLIQEAIAVLKRHPLIGRRVEADLRELVISRGKTGYVALYSHESDQDAVLILTIRHQREAGYIVS